MAVYLAFESGERPLYLRPLQNKEVEGRGVLGIKGASEKGGSKE